MTEERIERVSLKGTVPVYVEVDLETGQVERVRVDDESFRWVDRDDPEFAVELPNLEPVSNTIRDQALAIADSETKSWPSWSFG